MLFRSLGQMKQLNDMRRQAKALQKELEKEEEVYEKGGIKVKVNGAQQIIYLEVDGEDRDDSSNGSDSDQMFLNFVPLYFEP